MPKNIWFFLILFVLFQLSPVYANELHTPYDKILKTYVKNGKVDYAGLKKQRKPLDDYLNEMSKVTRGLFDAWNKDERLAYLINLYNAATLQLIIDNYPVKSIKDIGGLFSSPWGKEFVPLFGKRVSLDNIEHDIIRKEYFEPRIHLALVCAAKSCPHLRSEAYLGKTLAKQLDSQGFQFFSSPEGIRVDHGQKKVYLSSIMKWYKEDFASVSDFAQKYSKQKFTDYYVDWLKYDWSLNEQ